MDPWAAQPWARRIGALLCALALAASLKAPGASASAQSPREAQARLDQLTPQQRELLRRQLGAGAIDDSSDAALPLPIDDWRAPSPLGGAADSVALLEPKPDREATATAPLQRFGQTLFELGPERFQSTAFSPVPPDYVLGPGDEVLIELWGEISQRERQRIDRDGLIVLQEAGQVQLAGLTLDLAREELTRRYARVLSGVRADGKGSTFVHLGLGALRSIRVFVIGEAQRPGGYEMSAAATIFQALYAAGGPNDIGSMRSIRLMRGDRLVTELDLYELLVHGRRSGDLRLVDGDTVFIPVAERTIGVSGEIRRPAYYELRAGEDLCHAIDFAGGLSASARQDLAHVRRVRSDASDAALRGQRIDLSLPIDCAADSTRGAARLEDGDELRLLAVNPRWESYVQIQGAVANPGRYGFHPGMRVSELLAASGGLWHDAAGEAAMLVRVREDYTRESHSIDLQALSEGSDLQLAAMDSLHVFALPTREDARVVRIHGEVRNPGEYPYYDGMRLRDLLLTAQGPRESADPLIAEISRVDPNGAPDSRRLAQRFQVPIGEDGRHAEAGAFQLQNHDNVFVRAQPGWELQRNVYVEGEVAYPGSYSLLHRDERLSSILERAGGLLPTAYPEGFRLARSAGEVGNIGIDLQRALEQPGGVDDLILMAGDRITIPPALNSVKVVGEVGFPTSVLFRPGMSIGDYIDKAGGTTPNADHGQTKVIYPSGLSAQVRRWWRDPGVKPGSVILVPAKPEGEGIDWGEVVVSTTQVLSSLATIFLVVDRVGN